MKHERKVLNSTFPATPAAYRRYSTPDKNAVVHRSKSRRFRCHSNQPRPAARETLRCSPWIQWAYFCLHHLRATRETPMSLPLLPPFHICHHVDWGKGWTLLHLSNLLSTIVCLVTPNPSSILLESTGIPFLATWAVRRCPTAMQAQVKLGRRYCVEHLMIARDVLLQSRHRTVPSSSSKDWQKILCGTFDDCKWCLPTEQTSDCACTLK